MIEMTSEVHSWIEQYAGKTEPREDEYVDPADGLLHCKKCGGLRQTVIPNFGKPGYLTPRCICPCQMAAEQQRKQEEAHGNAWTESSAEKHRGCKTGICMTTPLPMTMGRTR